MAISQRRVILDPLHVGFYVMVFGVDESSGAIIQDVSHDIAAIELFPKGG